MRFERDPSFVRAFLDGAYDRLFAYYRNFSEEEWSRYPIIRAVTLHKAGTRGFWSVTIRQISNRLGEVVRSNFLKAGTKVRSALPLRYAARPLRMDSPDTSGDPRRLVVVDTPRDGVARQGMTFVPGRTVRKAA